MTWWLQWNITLLRFLAPDACSSIDLAEGKKLKESVAITMKQHIFYTCAEYERIFYLLLYFTHGQLLKLTSWIISESLYSINSTVNGALVSSWSPEIRLNIEPFILLNYFENNLLDYTHFPVSRFMVHKWLLLSIGFDM